MDAMIEVQNVNKSFGEEHVLKDVSHSFETGKIHGIVGNNGSGKTVLMKCILGFMKPTKGKATVFDKEIGKDCDFAPDTGMIIDSTFFLISLSDTISLGLVSIKPSINFYLVILYQITAHFAIGVGYNIL